MQSTTRSIPGVQLKPFSIDDKQVFDQVYAQLDFPLAEHSFSWIYLWDCCYHNLEWAMINGNICLFNTFEGKRSIWGPILPGNKLKDTLHQCFELCAQDNEHRGIRTKPMLMYLPEEMTKQYTGIKGCVLRTQNQDYLYKREDLQFLKGQKYRKKRNHKNHFMKTYPYQVESYIEEKHHDGCIKLLNKWMQQKASVLGSEHSTSLAYEYAANRKALMAASSLGLKGMVILVDGNVEAYSFGEQSSKHFATVFFEKTNLEMRGLSVFIFSEFSSLFDTEYINVGEDWEVDYLKEVKESYYPSMVRKIYAMERLRNGTAF